MPQDNLLKTSSLALSNFLHSPEWGALLAFLAEERDRLRDETLTLHPQNNLVDMCELRGKIAQIDEIKQKGFGDRLLKWFDDQQ